MNRDSNIICINNADGYYVPIQYGSSSMYAKYDPGSPITVFNSIALIRLFQLNIDILKKEIDEKDIERKEFKGFNGVTSTLYLCEILDNLYIDQYKINNMLVAINLDIVEDENTYSKASNILLGKNFISCCKGQFSVGGNVILSPSYTAIREHMNEATKVAFNINQTANPSSLVIGAIS